MPLAHVLLSRRWVKSSDLIILFTILMNHCYIFILYNIVSNCHPCQGSPRACVRTFYAHRLQECNRRWCWRGRASLSSCPEWPLLLERRERGVMWHSRDGGQSMAAFVEYCCVSMSLFPWVISLIVDLLSGDVFSLFYLLYCHRVIQTFMWFFVVGPRDLIILQSLFARVAQSLWRQVSCKRSW